MLEKLYNWFLSLGGLENSSKRKTWLMEDMGDPSMYQKELLREEENDKWSGLFSESISPRPDLAVIQRKITMSAILRKAVMDNYLSEGGAGILDGIDAYRYAAEMKELAGESCENVSNIP